jgi:hypothetical protein
MPAIELEAAFLSRLVGELGKYHVIPPLVLLVRDFLPPMLKWRRPARDNPTFTLQQQDTAAQCFCK